MYFGGTSSSRKKVCLRGNTNNVPQSKEELLEQARKEREKNKQQQQEENAVSLIQRTFRRFNLKKIYKNEQRLQFDNILLKQTRNINDIKELFIKLNYFYNENEIKDQNRLFICLQLILQLQKLNKLSFLQNLSLNDFNFFRLNKFIKFIISYLIKENDLILQKKKIALSTIGLVNFLQLNLFKTNKDFEIFILNLLKDKNINLSKLFLKMFLQFEDKEKESAISIFNYLLNSINNNEFILLKLCTDILSNGNINILSNILLNNKNSSLNIILDKIYCNLNYFIENFKTNEISILFIGNLIQLVNDQFILLSTGNSLQNNFGEESIVKYIIILSNLINLYSNHNEILNLLQKEEDKEENNLQTIIVKQLNLLFSRTHMQYLVDTIISITKKENNMIQCFCKLYLPLLLIIEKKNHKKFTNILYTLSYINNTSTVEEEGKNENYKLISILWHSIFYEDIIAVDRIVEHLETFHFFIKLYDTVLSIMDDDEFKVQQKPFTLNENIKICKFLKEIVFNLIWTIDEKDKNLFLQTFKEDVIKLLTKLQLRDVRLKYCPKDHFIISNNDDNHILNRIDIEGMADYIYSNQEVEYIYDDEEDNNGNNNNTDKYRNSLQQIKNILLSDNEQFRTIKNKNQFIEKTKELISKAPYLIPLNIRIHLFKNILELDKDDNYNRQHFIPPINIRRESDYIFNDSFSKLADLTATELKGPIRVQFIDKEGLEEAGIGQGVFKEFLFELSKVAFSTKYGLFKTTDDGYLYPNPYSSSLYPDGLDLRFYRFLGKLLGKSIYSDIVIDLPFAKFFVSKLLNSTNNDLINNLQNLDKELYKNLLFLKRTTNVEDLELTFTIVTGDDLTMKREINLMPNGENIKVNDKNKFSYIYRVAHFKLNHQIKLQSQAFQQGLEEIIPRKYLTLFDENELIDLICGSTQPIDIDDLYNNTIYSNGYSQEHRSIELFWDIVYNDLSSEQHVLLLKFICSLSRPPLLGFKDLHPKICIQKIDDTERLPSSSTCYSLLKLPCYKTRKEMKEKLIKALEQGTQSFGLT